MKGSAPLARLMALHHPIGEEWFSSRRRDEAPGPIRSRFTRSSLPPVPTSKAPDAPVTKSAA
jgi:hypothetical protein